MFVVGTGAILLDRAAQARKTSSSPMWGGFTFDFLISTTKRKARPPPSFITKRELFPLTRSNTCIRLHTIAGFSRTLKPRCLLPPSVPSRRRRYPPLLLLVVRSPCPHFHSLRFRGRPRQARPIHLIDRGTGSTERWRESERERERNVVGGINLFCPSALPA